LTKLIFCGNIITEIKPDIHFLNIQERKIDYG